MGRSGRITRGGIPAGIRLLAAGLLVAASLGCGSVNRLGEYDFRSLDLALATTFPPNPEVLSGPYFPGHPKDPIHAIIRAGSRIAREIEAQRVRPRLDSAAAMVDVVGEVTDRVGRRASRYLGARLVPDEDRADVILAVDIRDYGIDAEDWEAAVHFFVDAEVWLLDASDRRPIWKTRVRAKDPISPAIFGRSAVRDVVTAATLSSLSVEEIARSLDQLAFYTSEKVTDRLRSALHDARR
ncbi:MAG: hypothetical protein AB7R55_23735 [Gemmatimonadales bacterium]